MACYAESIISSTGPNTAELRRRYGIDPDPLSTFSPVPAPLFTDRNSVTRLPQQTIIHSPRYVVLNTPKQPGTMRDTSTSRIQPRGRTESPDSHRVREESPSERGNAPDLRLLLRDSHNTLASVASEELLQNRKRNFLQRTFKKITLRRTQRLQDNRTESFTASDISSGYFSFSKND
ncbi:hypothetical protein M426DRAFT_14496 [Hypoxylon sp. CI-4A]|nr:hypothetical protein M426DRAFT_14496 [Hypoxylon sp. CI-4A]